MMMHSGNSGIRLIAGLTAAVTSVIFLSGCSGPTKAGKEARAEMQERYEATSADLAAQQARQNFEVGNLDDALNAADMAVGFQPEVADHHVMRGRILLELQHLEHARTSLLKAVELNPAHADAHYYLGLVYQRWSNNVDALEHYRAAYEQDRLNPSYMLATLETLISMRDIEGAEAFVDLNISYFEHNAAMRRAQGHLYLMKGQPAKAAEAFNQALLLSPEDKGIVEDLAHALFKSKDYAQAEYYVDRALKDPEREARLDLRHMKARCLVAQRRLVDARFIYLGLTQDFPAEREVWYELGMISLQLGDTKRVQQVAARMISSWATRHEGYLLRGLLAIHMSNPEAARGDLLQALSLAPNDEDVRLMLSMAFIQIGMKDVARSTLARALEANPTSQRIQRLMSTVNGDVASVEIDSN